MRSILSLVLLCLITAPCSAWSLRVQGLVTEYLSGAPVKGVLVRVYKDGSKQAMSTTAAHGRYGYTLDNNARYILRFSAPGYQTKCFAIDTHGPEWSDQRGEKEVEVEMTLFRKITDMDLSYFDLPMGIGRFEPGTGMLRWDQAYDARIRGDVAVLMSEYERRMQAIAAIGHDVAVVGVRP